ncbi:hypothetical protein [Nakamurella endophytica]|uniref:Metalloprotease n=1 Tax=Nakamurella endophytica TaxID=1748367 RepID=A0A917SNI0_9ACTN|nr:hypothetical protein [Nakamurella endophytica]GGL90680.1 hypothetical protein GCM10011594_07890 [Nakamurella endophytica]
MLVLLVTVATAAAQGPEAAAGTPVAAARIDPVAGGGAVRDATAPAPGPATDGAVAGVLADLVEFWRTGAPAALTRRMTPLAGGAVAVDSSAAQLGPGGAPCIGAPGDIAGNAYYCPSADAIVYDSAGLVPVLLGRYGVAALAASFGHEYGHAVQARLGPTAAQRSAQPARYPGLLVEAQGDCYAGAFLAWVVAGRSAHVHLPPESLLVAVAPLLDFRDAPTVRPDAPTAHGLAIDRLRSALVGLRRGAAACRALNRAALHPALGTAGTVADGAARFPDAGAALAAGRPGIQALAARWSAASGSGSTTGPRPSGAAPTGTTGGSAAGTSVTPDPADLAAAAPLGQFAEAAALALAVGRTLPGRDGARASDTLPSCFAGAWTETVYGHARPGQLGSWAGDVDEALDLVRSRPGARFADLAAFADGYDRGLAGCS